MPHINDLKYAALGGTGAMNDLELAANVGGATVNDGWYATFAGGTQYSDDALAYFDTLPPEQRNDAEYAFWTP